MENQGMLKGEGVFLQNIHYFRGLAIVALVATHTLQNFTSTEESTLFHWMRAVFAEASIWFTFIAGFLFQHLSENYRTSRYLKSKANNVILPYLIISIPAFWYLLIWAPAEIPVPFQDYAPSQQILLMLMTGSHMAQLWFIPMIALIYVLAPLLIWADRKGVLYTAMPLLLLFSLLTGREAIQNFTGWGLFASPLSKAAYLLAAYIFGMFCSRYYEKCRALTIKYWPLLLASTLIAFICHTQFGNDGLIHWLLLWKLLATPALLYALEFVPKTVGRVLAALGDYSFGIFFIHGYVLTVPRLLGNDSLSGSIFTITDAGLWTLFLAIVLAACSAFLWVVRKSFKRHSRKLVGC